MDLKTDLTDKSDKKNVEIKLVDDNLKDEDDDNDYNVVELQGKESKLHIEKTKLGWCLPTNDLGKAGQISKMSVDSFWVYGEDSDSDSDFDIEVEINEDSNLKMDLKKEDLEGIIKAKK